MRRLVKKISLIVICFMIPSATALAEDKPVSSPLQFYDKELKAFINAPGIASEIETQINGQTAYTTLTQYYYNDTQSWQEGKYTYPIPEKAAVHSLTMMVGNKRIIGFVHEKDKAKKIYEQAKENGQAAGLVEQHRTNIFKTSVANIPPQSMIAISIEYQTQISMDDYEFTYRMPMAITPRFDNFHPEMLAKLASSKEQPWAEDVITRMELFGFEGGQNPVSMKVKLNAGFEVAKVQSTSHDIKWDSVENGASIELSKKIIKGEQDFVLHWRPKNITEVFAANYSEAYDGAYYSQIMILPPRDVSDIEGAAPPRHITFVIDTSGSMAGPSIDQAKAALMSAVMDLNENDYFSIIEFNTDFTRLFKESMPATKENIRKAVAQIAALNADGGTNYEPALTSAYDEAPIPEHLRQIVFLTDGAISYEERVQALIRKKAQEGGMQAPRLFTIGIGSAPNSHLMRVMAEEGRGSITFISDLNIVEEKMSALFKKMTLPAMTNVKLELPSNPSAEIIPYSLPDLMAGEPVSVLVKSDAPLQNMVLSGETQGQVKQITREFNKMNEAKGLHKLYARRKIDELESPFYVGKYDMRDREIMDIGVAYQVVSSLTSLVAVDEDILRPNGAPLVTQKYDPTLPKGWQEGRMSGLEAARAYEDVSAKGDKPRNELNKALDLPQTASGYAMGMLAGFVMMLCALLILLRGRAYAPQV